MNTGGSWPSLVQARSRVLGIQTKLHRWATDDPECRFDDLFNLVCDPAFLVVAWDRVRRNTGARSGGVDGRTVRTIESEQGVAAFLDDLRADLKARTFKPLPVREVMIPKPGTRKRRRLGIPTVSAYRDVVQFVVGFGLGGGDPSVPFPPRAAAAGVARAAAGVGSAAGV